jgi:hypothetical protein
MASTDLFNEPDKEGFEKLLQSDFVEYKGMIFRKHLFERQFVEEMLEKNTPEFLLQSQVNHESMISYGADIETQRSHGHELQKIWLSRLIAKFPHLYSWVTLEDSESEVIVSVRASHS